MRERQYYRYGQHRRHRSYQGYGPQHIACHEPLPRVALFTQSNKIIQEWPPPKLAAAGCLSPAA